MYTCIKMSWLATSCLMWIHPFAKPNFLVCSAEKIYNYLDPEILIESSGYHTSLKQDYDTFVTAMLNFIV